MAACDLLFTAHMATWSLLSFWDRSNPLFMLILSSSLNFWLQTSSVDLIEPTTVVGQERRKTQSIQSTQVTSMGNNINTATHLLTLFVVLIPILSEGCKRPPVLFNFGDSNSDTGGFNAAFGYTSNPPYGRAFFHRPTGRFCDGRLVIDFMREKRKEKNMR